MARAVDDVVQGIVRARWALDVDDPDRATAALDETLRVAQALASQLLGPAEVAPGDLVRRERADDQPRGGPERPRPASA